MLDDKFQSFKVSGFTFSFFITVRALNKVATALSLKVAPCHAPIPLAASNGYFVYAGTPWVNRQFYGGGQITFIEHIGAWIVLPLHNIRSLCMFGFFLYELVNADRFILWLGYFESRVTFFELFIYWQTCLRFLRVFYDWRIKAKDINCTRFLLLKNKT